MSYKILIFGNHLLSNLTPNDIYHNKAEITISSYPNDRNYLQEIDEYDITIIDMCALFYGGRYNQDDEKILSKSISLALEKGSNICFLHYDTNNNREVCLGSKILYDNGISLQRIDKPVINGQIKNNLFRRFLKKWGTTNMYTPTYDTDKYEDIIYQSGDKMLGFSLKIANGLCIYLPFQMNSGVKNTNTTGINILIDTLLNYISDKDIDIPDWANKPFFNEEEVIYDEIERLNKQLDNLNNELNTFSEAKSLLTSNGYNLENKIPKFISNHLGLNTERNETFKEDFWISNNDNQREIIGEVKSSLKGFRKSMIYSLYNHRESNDLDETFPGLLVVNHHLQAGSWKDKIKPIDKQDYKIACSNNITVIRVEDLVNLWYGIKLMNLSIDLIDLLKSNHGWLKINYSDRNGLETKYYN